MSEATISRAELLEMKDKLATELAAWHVKNTREIANCVANHSSLAEHYWQPRYRLEQKLRTVNDMLSVVA